MNIAAGILLIITAIIDLIAGALYVAGGALTSGAANVGSKLAGSAQLDPAAQLQVSEVTTTGFMVGGGLQLYGIFVLVVAGLLIAGAVFLFQRKKAKFIIIAGVLAIVIEVIGIVSLSFGITNLVGLVAGALAIIAAISIPKEDMAAT